MYEELAPALAVIVPFPEVFDVSSLRPELLQVGISNETVQILVENHVNVNRVRFFISANP